MEVIRQKGVEFLANKTARRFSTWISYTYSTDYNLIPLLFF
jgi:hypothetical protein